MCNTRVARRLLLQIRETEMGESAREDFLVTLVNLVDTESVV